LSIAAIFFTKYNVSHYALFYRSDIEKIPDMSSKSVSNYKTLSALFFVNVILFFQIIIRCVIVNKIK